MPLKILLKRIYFFSNSTVNMLLVTLKVKMNGKDRFIFFDASGIP
jgi:hypothetical protein